MDNFQGNAVVNYTDAETSYTRIIEHKHFEFGQQEKTVITKEHSKTWTKVKSLITLSTIIVTTNCIKSIKPWLKFKEMLFLVGV